MFYCQDLSTCCHVTDPVLFFPPPIYCRLVYKSLADKRNAKNLTLHLFQYSYFSSIKNKITFCYSHQENKDLCVCFRIRRFLFLSDYQSRDGRGPPSHLVAGAGPGAPLLESGPVQTLRHPWTAKHAHGQVYCARCSTHSPVLYTRSHLSLGERRPYDSRGALQRMSAVMKAPLHGEREPRQLARAVHADRRTNSERGTPASPS